LLVKDNAQLFGLGGHLANGRRSAIKQRDHFCARLAEQLHRQSGFFRAVLVALELVRNFKHQLVGAFQISARVFDVDPHCLKRFVAIRRAFGQLEHGRLQALGRYAGHFSRVPQAAQCLGCYADFLRGLACFVGGTHDIHEARNNLIKRPHASDGLCS